MKTVDLFRNALSALGANKLRSSLTILGIAIGVFSVVGVMTALSAVRQSIDTGLSIFAANVFEISKMPAIDIADSRRRYRGRPNITPKQAQEFVDRMSERGIPVTLYGSDGNERVRFAERSTSRNIEIFGTNENFLLTHKYSIAFGRNLSAADIQFDRPVIVLGHSIREQVFPNEDPIGQTVIADGSKYTVIGVLEKRGDLFGSSLDNLVLIPITRFVPNNWNWRRSMSISVLSPSPEWIPATQDVAIGIFRQVRGLKPGQDNNFEIYSNDSLQDAFAEIAVVIGTGGLLISAIALLCAGVGIMNIMLVSVTERTREIGLLKSIGARRSNILYQFLLESIGLSLLGGFIGIIVGWAAGNAVAASMAIPMIFPFFWITVALLTCSFIGVSFGFFPALRASRLEPVEALRFE